MDRRVAERIPLFAACAVHCAVTGRRLGDAVDLTVRGLRLVCDRPLEIFLDYPLVLRLDDGQAGIREIVLEGRCVWTLREASPRVDSAGIEFRRISRAAKAALASYLGGRGGDRRVS